MTTRAPSKKSAARVSQSANTDTTEATVAPATNTATAPKEAAPETGASIVFLDPPPASANIPSPPDDYVVPTGLSYRAVLPRGTELAALPIAVKDLGKFTTYAQTLGTTVPPYDQVNQGFSVANQWSSMRTRSSAWDTYCVLQEGIAWTTIRQQMERLRPAFQLAAAGDPTILTRFPGLATLLGAKKVIADKAVATRAANKKAVSEGKAPLHGQIGKKRLKTAEKAAYAASTSTPPPATAVAPAAIPAATPAAASAATPAAAPAATVVVPAPVASTPAPVAQPTVAPAPVAVAPNGVVNGAGH